MASAPLVGKKSLVLESIFGSLLINPHRGRDFREGHHLPAEARLTAHFRAFVYLPTPDQRPGFPEKLVNERRKK